MYFFTENDVKKCRVKTYITENVLIYFQDKTTDEYRTLLENLNDLMEYVPFFYDKGPSVEINLDITAVQYRALHFKIDTISYFTYLSNKSFYK